MSGLGGSTGLTYARILENIQSRPITSRRRSGRVFFVDTFEDYTALLSEKWRLGTGTQELSTEHPKQGKQSIKMTTGDQINNLSQPELYLGLVPPGRYGLELEIMSQAGAANIKELYIQLCMFDGAKYHMPLITWLGEANKKFQYMNSGGGFTDIGDFDLYVEGSYLCYHNWKLVVDYKKGEYVKFICDHKEYDLKGIAYKIDNSAQAPKLCVFIRLKNAVTTAARICYVDNVILTDQEP